MKKISKYFEREYKKCFSYLIESKKYIYWGIAIFFLFAFFGFFLPLPEEFSTMLLNYFEKLVLQTQNYSFSEMIIFLFTNNSTATFIGLFSGLFFGILSISNLIMNGFVLGFAANLSVMENGIFSLWRLFPHGIFELPAVFISLGLGIKLGTFVFQKDVLKSLKEFFYNSVRVYLLIVLPLLVIAALIEGALIVFGI